MSGDKKSKAGSTNVTRISAGSQPEMAKRAQLNIGIIAGAVIMVIFIMIVGSINNAGSNGANDDTPAVATSQEEEKAPEPEERPVDIIARRLANEATSERFSDSELCNAVYEVDGDSYLNERGIARGTTTTFIESGKLVFEDEDCGTYMLSIDVNGVDSRGNDSTFRFATFTADRNDFSAYNWPELKGTSVGAQFHRDGILRLPLNSRMSTDDFWYN